MKRVELTYYSLDSYLCTVEDWILKRHPRDKFPFLVFKAIRPLRSAILDGKVSRSDATILISLRPDMVARRLLQGGTNEEVLARIYKLIDEKGRTTK